MFVYISFKKWSSAVTKAIWGHLFAPYLLFLEFLPHECFRGLTKPSVELRRQMVGKADEGGSLTSNGFHPSHVQEILHNRQFTPSRKHVSETCCVLAAVGSIFIYLWHISIVMSITSWCILASKPEACLVMVPEPSPFTTWLSASSTEAKERGKQL